MKKYNYLKTVLALGILSLVTLVGTSDLRAEDRYRGGDNDGRRGYRNDRHHHHHHRHHRGSYYRSYSPRSYVYYKSHRGYWEDRSGARFFIRID